MKIVTTYKRWYLIFKTPIYQVIDDNEKIIYSSGYKENVHRYKNNKEKYDNAPLYVIEGNDLNEYVIKKKFHYYNFDDTQFGLYYHNSNDKIYKSIEEAEKVLENERKKFNWKVVKEIYG